VRPCCSFFVGEFSCRQLLAVGDAGIQLCFTRFIRGRALAAQQARMRPALFVVRVRVRVRVLAPASRGVQA